jgi:hypothetical protein
VASVAHSHEKRRRREPSRQCFNDGEKAQVEKYDAVVSMFDDIGELVDVQARVDGMQYGAGPRNRKIQFQVAIAIPRERTHPVARRDAKARKRVGHAT